MFFNRNNKITIDCAEKKDFEIDCAEKKDFEAVFALLTQNHASAFMSMGDLSKEDFYQLYQQWLKKSTVFVIREGNKIVALHRLCTMSADSEQAHLGELCSLAVDKERLGHNFGQVLFNYTIEYIHEHMPYLKKIIIGQDSDNKQAIAFSTQKLGFKGETFAPGWYRREKGQYNDKWHVGAYWLALYLDKAFEGQCLQTWESFTPSLPVLLDASSAGSSLRIIKRDQDVFCYFNEKQQAKLRWTAHTLRAKHIQAWSIELAPNANLEIVGLWLRQVIEDFSKTCKKIEVSSGDQKVITLLAQLGFHYRGKMTGSYQKDSNYYNELLADFGYFDITDAREVVNLYMNNGPEKEAVYHALSHCEQAVAVALANRSIDTFGAIYLNNLALQITCEGIGEKAIHIYELSGLSSPWYNLIDQLPEYLRKPWLNLAEVTLGHSALQEKANLQCRL